MQEPNVTQDSLQPVSSRPASPTGTDNSPLTSPSPIPTENINGLPPVPLRLTPDDKHLHAPSLFNSTDSFGPLLQGVEIQRDNCLNLRIASERIPTDEDSSAQTLVSSYAGSTTPPLTGDSQKGLKIPNPSGANSPSSEFGDREHSPTPTTRTPGITPKAPPPSRNLTPPPESPNVPSSRTLSFSSLVGAAEKKEEHNDPSDHFNNPPRAWPSLTIEIPQKMKEGPDSSNSPDSTQFPQNLSASLPGTSPLPSPFPSRRATEPTPPPARQEEHTENLDGITPDIKHSEGSSQVNRRFNSNAVSFSPLPSGSSDGQYFPLPPEEMSRSGNEVYPPSPDWHYQPPQKPKQDETHATDTAEQRLEDFKRRYPKTRFARGEKNSALSDLPISSISNAVSHPQGNTTSRRLATIKTAQEPRKIRKETHETATKNFHYLFPEIREGNFAIWGGSANSTGTNIGPWLKAIIEDYDKNNKTNYINSDNIKNILKSCKEGSEEGSEILKTSYSGLFDDFQTLIKKVEQELEISPQNKEKLEKHLAFCAHIKKRAAVLMLLQKKINTDFKHQRLIESLESYKFSNVEKDKVVYALLAGDLRVTDIIKRGLEHKAWSFITFKWANIFSSKKLSKEKVLQIAGYSWDNQPFKRTPEQDSQRNWRGMPLVIGKILTSMALCIFFVCGVLAIFGTPFAAVVVVAGVVALCNGAVCWYSRGQAMLNSAAFEPEKQKIYETAAENSSEKHASRWDRKAFFGFFTLIACVAAGATAWTGMAGMLVFFGAAVLLSNPFGLALVATLALIAAISFYSFQATGIEENYVKFKNLFISKYKEGWRHVVPLAIVSFFFLSAYGVLTWFTVATGIDNIFKMAGGNRGVFDYTLSAISTFTTIIVNTCSQVYKVFNPKTYDDLREKLNNGCNAYEKGTGWEKVRIICRGFMLVGNELAYSIAGGIKGGIEVGNQLTGSIIGKIIFATFSPIILLLVSVAFTWPSVLQSKPAPAKTDTTKESNKVSPATTHETSNSKTPLLSASQHFDSSLPTNYGAISPSTKNTSPRVSGNSDNKETVENSWVRSKANPARPSLANNQSAQFTSSYHSSHLSSERQQNTYRGPQPVMPTSPQPERNHDYTVP